MLKTYPVCCRYKLLILYNIDLIKMYCIFNKHNITIFQVGLIYFIKKFNYKYTPILDIEEYRETYPLFIYNKEEDEE